VPTPTTNLRLSSARGQAEKHLIITLSADTLTQIAGGDFEIVFDPSVVKRVADVTPLGLAANFKLDFHDTGNGLLAIALSNDVEISGNGDLLTIDFELQSSAPLGASPLTLASASLHDLFGRDFITSFANNTLTQQSGTITVAQGATNFPIYLPVVSKK
jgi:hypothetical protein